jgi:hypothetical protein
MTGLEISVLKTVGSKGASWAWDQLRDQFIARRFKQIFGDGVVRPSFGLVYGELALNPQIQIPMPYVKIGGNPQGRFSMNTPVSQCELRAANYLSSAIGSATGNTPALRSDTSVRQVVDLDFISFGGPMSNFKSDDCQTNPGNRLAFFDQGPAIPQFLDRATRTACANCADRNFDYGMVLKVHPTAFPKRTWIMCAGIAEWGTSGAAWYLANRWNDLRKLVKDRPFVLVVRVRPQQDESAESIALSV